ncbi:MAG: DUF368 domain-containing protein [Bacillota bacterium]|nr:DUF368 domain-containing protein [Bacillota bacterium]
MNSSDNQKPLADWLWRVAKGFLIGVGAIVPGLSGGVLMVVFGVYDRLIAFLANLRRRFFEDFLFFLPIGIGGLLGVFLFSIFVKRAFETYEALFVTLFIGFVAGTLPTLNRDAKRQGRGPGDIVAFLAAATLVLVMMLLGDRQFTDLEPNFALWVLSGALVGLGFIVPGLSPSNFLMYLGLYQKMAAGIEALDFSVLLPLALGLAGVIALLSKFVHWLITRHYSTIYHIILGTVVGSSLAIFPTIVFPAFTPAGVAATGMAAEISLLLCVLLFGLGLVASLLFSRLETRYAKEAAVSETAGR